MKILDVNYLNFSDVAIILQAYIESRNGVITYNNTKSDKVCKYLEVMSLMKCSQYYSGYSHFILTNKGMEIFNEIKRKLEVE